MTSSGCYSKKNHKTKSLNIPTNRDLPRGHKYVLYFLVKLKKKIPESFLFSIKYLSQTCLLDPLASFPDQEWLQVAVSMLTHQNFS